MFWFDRKDERALFLDKRSETHLLRDRTLVIEPDVQADFRALPFDDNTFPLVVFDPPHLVKNGREGANGWAAKFYGSLAGEDWKQTIRQGFSECFRVLSPNGTLVFKWNECDIPVAQVLALTPERPLFGNRSGKTSKSHWIVFQKSVTPNT